MNGKTKRAATAYRGVMPPVSGTKGIYQIFSVSSRRLVSAARGGTLQHLRVRSTGFIIRAQRRVTNLGVYTTGTFGTGGIIRTLLVRIMPDETLKIR